MLKYDPDAISISGDDNVMLDIPEDRANTEAKERMLKKLAP
jgi:hypothetical protein